MIDEELVENTDNGLLTDTDSKHLARGNAVGYTLQTESEEPLPECNQGKLVCQCDAVSINFSWKSQLLLFLFYANVSRKASSHTRWFA